MMKDVKLEHSRRITARSLGWRYLIHALHDYDFALRWVQRVETAVASASPRPAASASS